MAKFTVYKKEMSTVLLLSEMQTAGSHIALSKIKTAPCKSFVTWLLQMENMWQLCNSE